MTLLFRCKFAVFFHIFTSELIVSIEECSAIPLEVDAFYVKFRILKNFSGILIATSMLAFLVRRICSAIHECQFVVCNNRILIFHLERAKGASCLAWGMRLDVTTTVIF